MEDMREISIVRLPFSHTITMKYTAATVNARGNNKNAGIGRGAVATMITDTKKTTTERQSASLTIGSSFMCTSPTHRRAIFRIVSVFQG